MLSLVLAFAGCQPKETALSGQMFIVTQGAANIRLGDVEIVLIEKRQVAAFLQRRHLEIESEKALRSQEVATASELAMKAQQELDWFLANRPFTTNLDYVNAKTDYDGAVFVRSNMFLTRSVRQARANELENQYVQTRRRVTDGGVRLGGKSPRLQTAKSAYATKAIQDAKDAYQTAINALREIDVQINRKQSEEKELRRELDAIERRAKADETAKLDVAKSRLRQAEMKLEHWPTTEDFLTGFSPVVIRKATTDASGNFSLTYPRDGTYTVFAKAQRAVVSLANSAPEKYYWLVNAPSDVRPARLNLSNSKLVDVDPDGYLRSR